VRCFFAGARGDSPKIRLPFHRRMLYELGPLPACAARLERLAPAISGHCQFRET
jgi:hypothetical protein